VNLLNSEVHDLLNLEGMRARTVGLYKAISRILEDFDAIVHTNPAPPPNGMLPNPPPPLLATATAGSEALGFQRILRFACATSTTSVQLVVDWYDMAVACRKDVLGQFSMVSIELFNIVEDINKVNNGFVVYPRTSTPKMP
jgi:hypothetical protein